MKTFGRLLTATIFISFSPANASDDCSLDFAAVFERVSPSVVQVYAVSIDPFSLLNRVQHGAGTGFIVDDQGNVVTNAHLVYGADTILIGLADDKMLPAEIIGVDPLSDLAVIRTTTQYPALIKATLGTSSDLEIGDEVLAVGYPFGIGKTATRGIVSGKERVMPFSTSSWMTPMVQTDAAINPGNSGGPLVNRCGEVVAVNTIGSSAAENISFSIPIDTVTEFLPQLIERGRVIRPWHGINGAIVPMPLVFSFGIPPGYMIETIEPGSPAEEIGLRGGSFPIVIGNTEYLLGGDVISEINGEQITDMETIFRLARSTKVGDELSIKYYREGVRMSAQVVLPERPILPGDTLRFRSVRHQ